MNNAQHRYLYLIFYRLTVCSVTTLMYGRCKMHINCTHKKEIEIMMCIVLDNKMVECYVLIWNYPYQCSVSEGNRLNKQDTSKMQFHCDFKAAPGNLASWWPQMAASLRQLFEYWGLQYPEVMYHEIRRPSFFFVVSSWCRGSEEVHLLLMRVDRTFAQSRKHFWIGPYTYI